MKKTDLIRYIKRENLTQEERKRIVEWLDSSQANRDYYNGLKNSWVMSHLPQERASSEDFAQLNRRMNSKRLKINTVILWSQRVAAILFLPLLVVTLYSLFKIKPTETLSAEPTYTTYYVNKGVKSRVELPDGTKVWLNSDSYLKCPDTFDKESRQVTLSGEAFFEVTKDPTKPFVVNTDKAVSVRVTGTSFNVSSYNDDNYVYTTLVSGSVNVTISDKTTNREKTIAMVPNEQVSFYAINGTVTKQVIDPELYTCWRKGWLCLENTPLTEVVKKLERWHGYNFVIKSPQLSNLRFTAKFNTESLVQVMELLKKSSGFRYKIEESSVIIY